MWQQRASVEHQMACMKAMATPSTCLIVSRKPSVGWLAFIRTSKQLHISSPTVRWPNNKLFRYQTTTTFHQRGVSTFAFETVKEDERAPFDLDLAVLLAGFAFEAYNTPSENGGTREKDGSGCEVTYLSEEFLREVYDGQLTVKLKKGAGFPAMDLWGLSDPYVVISVGESVVQSKTIWASLEPIWNENFLFNVVDPNSQLLQIAAWDANIIGAHQRMGNVGISLGHLSDGKWHNLELEMEGMGGGGRVFLEVCYKTFAEIDAAQRPWEVPFLSEFLRGKGLDSALKSVFGEEGIRASDFVRSTFGSFDRLSQSNTSEVKPTITSVQKAIQSQEWYFQKTSGYETTSQEVQSESNSSSLNSHSSTVVVSKDSTMSTSEDNELTGEDGKGQFPPDNDYFQKLASNIYNALREFSRKESDPYKESDQDILARLGDDAQIKAEASYIDIGLALRSAYDGDESTFKTSPIMVPPLFLPDEIKRASQSIMCNMEEMLGSWLILGTPNYRDKLLDQKAMGTAELSNQMVDQKAMGTAEEIDEEKGEEMRKMFKRAESAMEAWAMLATSLRCSSFVKSEFDKICFLENGITDTQLAIWRDLRHHRLVVAFRGTEQTKWKDLKTDLMLVPTGFNPERVGGGDFESEAMVHSGFLNAYDSVKTRILSIIRSSVRYPKSPDSPTWHIYITGHSLGGALATLLAVELSCSKVAKTRHIFVTMYNFGSPRVGNKAFAESYNKVVKDSWRVVNHRDIIPTVPRMMGYCHVAQEMRLSKEKVSRRNCSLLEDGFHGDIIGEATPEQILQELMKGEKQVIEKLLQTEVTMLRAIRDGSALMQHMEDFYYISLLEITTVRGAQKWSTIGEEDAE